MTSLKFIGIVLVFLLGSCKKHMKLSKIDFQWMPYTGAETLIFQSNSGEIDTISLIGKDTIVAYPEAQSFFGTTYEAVLIVSKHNDPNLLNGSRSLISTFLKIGKSTNGKAELDISLSAIDANFYRNSKVLIDSLEKIEPLSFEIDKKQFKDVYIIKGEDYLDFENRSNFITSIFWSKSKGLLRFDKKDGKIWILKSN